MTRSIPSTSASKKKSKPKWNVPFKIKNKRASQLPSDSEEKENTIAIKYNNSGKNNNTSTQLKSKPGQQQIQQKNKKQIMPQSSSESSDSDNYYSDDDDDDDDDDNNDDKNNKENISLKCHPINSLTTNLNVSFGSLALGSNIINNNPNTGNNNSNARNSNTRKKSSIIVAKESETSEEDVDIIMNRPRKVFKPTKKSDKIIPTNQKILVNKSSDLSSSDDQNSSQDYDDDDDVEEGFNNNNNNFSGSSSDENINPNHYVRRSNNNNFNFNNFNLSRSVSPNQNFNLPSRSVSPNQNFNLPSRSVSPNQNFNPPSRPVSPNQNFNLPSRPVSPNQNFNLPSRPVSPNQFKPLSHFLHGNLSACEQELLAHESGSPLINIPEKPRSPQTGLIGVIVAREVRRRSLKQEVFAHKAEAERERERERRLIEQRQQSLIAEREHSLYNRPGAGPGAGPAGIGVGVGRPGSDFKSSRFISNQPQYGLAPINSQRNFYNEGYGYADGEDDEGDDVPLGVSGYIMPIQKQRQHQFQQNQKRHSRNQKIYRHDYE